LRGALAHHAYLYPSQAEELWKILDTASAAAPGYDRGDNWARWTRYIHEAMECPNPITIATIFAMAKHHVWMGWVPLAVTSQGNFANQPGGLSSITAGLDVTFANLPHRQFLYGIDASRGEITVLAAPGGMGKSSLAIGIGVNVAVGKDFLQEKIWGNELTTLYVNGEDSGEEIRRRVWAYCLQHYISEAAIKRFRLLGADDWRTHKLSFLRTEKGASVLDEGGIQFLELLLQEIRPDLLVLDPLVSFCGGGNVNDNAVMAVVIRALKRLATHFGCAILVVHHTRKGGEPGTAEAISGASSIVNLARRAIMVVPMTKEEANGFAILPSEYRAYFKVVSAKSNLVPPSDQCPWYKLESVTLSNAEPPTYPKGDNVQAVVRVQLSSLKKLSDPDHQKIKKAILDVVDQGKSVGAQHVPYSPHLSGAHNARALINDAMVAAQAATAPRRWHDADLNAAVIRAIRDLKTDGALIDIESKSGRFRRRRGLGVDWGKSPWKSKSNDVAPQAHTPMQQSRCQHEVRGQSVNYSVNR
jgi:AAA domain-containing protein